MARSLADIIQFFDELEATVVSLWDGQSSASSSFWSPATDVYTTEQYVNVIVELAGVERENLKILVSPLVLEVSGTRPTPASFHKAQNFYGLEIAYGLFRKRITLPCRVEPRAVRTQLKDGLLRLRLRRAQTRSIAVE
ncbi:MAG: Hsp20/alpha crystallin family protein [candidate division WOR-3 bacterium]